MTGDLPSLLERCWFPPPGTSVVCAVSGGPDSSALLVLATAADLEVTAVHVDHGLRPGSESEAAVVRSLAERFGARFRSARALIGPGGDLEARARQARLDVVGPDAMTGHTADDQAETMLLNLLRGAGLDGLSAMTPGWRHPMLGLRRHETVALCERFGIEPVIDSMNADPRFVRTRLRHELMPMIEDISQRDPVPLLLRSADTARSAAAVLEALAETVDPTSVAELQEVSVAVAATALRRWLSNESGYPPSRAELDRVMSVVRGDAVGCQISGNRTVRRTAGILRVETPARWGPGSAAGVGR